MITYLSTNMSDQHLSNICYDVEVKGYVRLADLAQKWNVTPDALRMQIHRGALAGIKEGRDWFVTEEEAQRYEAEQLGKPGAASPRHPRPGNRKPRQPKQP